MVIVKIGDGLGNQMFNYVCGYAVAKHDNDILKMDTSEVDNSTFRSYGLDKFNIDCNLRESFSNRSFFHKVYKRLRRNLKYRVIIERGGSYSEDPRVYEKKIIRNKYLHGYFQSLAFYNTCSEDIDRQFTPREELPEHVKELIGKFEAGEYCSFHVRGGDIPPLPIAYYKKAVEIVRKENPNIKFVVFSNDKKTATEYAKELCGDSADFIWNMGKFTDFDELFLMKACNYHILSDSTFARWAAILDKNNMLTVAPNAGGDERAYKPEWKLVPLK